MLVTHAEAAPAGDGLRADLPPGAAGQWCQLRVDAPGANGWWARATFTDPARGQVVRSVFLGPERKTAAGGRRETLLHIPIGSNSVSLQMFGDGNGAILSLRVIPRWETAIRLAWAGRGAIAFCLRGSPLGLAGRLRAVLGQAPSRQGEPPPYDVWIATCETRLASPPNAPLLDIQAVIVGGSDSAIAKSLGALQAQTVPSPHPALRIACPEDWSRVTAHWIVVLAAGEVLAPAALAWFAAAAAAWPAADCIIADFDRLTETGRRHDPVFLPGGGKLILQSGLPAIGPCAVRWGHVPRPDELGMDAASTRLAWMLQCIECTVHVARILAHVPASAPAFRSFASNRIRHEAFAPQVTALVPSLAASMRVANCLRQVDSRTAYINFRVELLLSSPDRARAGVLRTVSRLSRVEIRNVAMQSFNYAAVNNRGATLAPHADYLLLLNDDVVPVNTDWLDRMLAHMADPTVGIVGARLLYGNGMVQHEGVIMGLADLCEHAGRLRAPNDSGIHGIGLVTREVSAVTAACMLVRASVYHDLGGLDEGFAIALNDVDFCLRAGQAGWRIVYCAEAELLHYESLSLGRHYAGGRSALESVEVRRLRDRWSAAISDDPCYNPQASVDPGREWQPAFCPRAVPPCRRYI
jgi:hypothetical protein